MGKKTEKQRNAQTRKPTEKRKVSLSSVTKQYKGWNNRNKAAFWLILIVAIAAPVSIISGLSASIGGLPSQSLDRIKISVINGGDFTNMTEKYSVTAFKINSSDITFTSFEFYRSWIVGENGSAMDLNVKIGEDNVSAFAIHFETTEPGYGEFADFYLYIDINGIYDVTVWKDPDNVTVAVFDESMSSNITGNSDFYLTISSSNSTDAGYAPVWHPNLYEYTNRFFHINFTFSGPVNGTDFKMTKVIVDPYMINSTRTGNVFNKVFTNETEVEIGFYLVNGFHSYELYVNTTLANVTSVKAYYGTTLVQNVF